MKKNLKIVMLTLMLTSALNANAQTFDLHTPVQNILNEIKAVFPLIMAIVFLIVAIVNSGHFTQEGGDWKKGLIKVVAFTGFVGIVIGLFVYFAGLTL
jgi:hypothetical protein